MIVNAARGAAAVVLLSACGLSLAVGLPGGSLDEDGGADATLPPRDAYVADATKPDADRDATLPNDASADAPADATTDKDAARDAAPDAADAGKAERRVFVSTALSNGMEIAGLAGGDTLCKTEATAANLGGTWHAILAQNEQYAAIIARIGNRADPIVRIDGKPVAASITALLAATPTLDNAITLDATGKSFPGAIAWTGITAGAGATGASTNHCVKWASAAAAQMGVVGKAAAVDAQFLMQNAGQGIDTCDTKHRIYCIEE